MSDTRQSAKGTTFSADEKAAMKERAKEAKAEQKRGADKAEGLKDLLEKIAGMEGPDRAMAERVHELVTAAAPDLTPKTWYGMPAYARDGKIVCFFQPASKFKTRYSTLGFNEDAALDDGAMWPVAYALTELNAAVEKQITELVKKAAG